jgi:hypothetical protein
VFSEVYTAGLGCTGDVDAQQPGYGGKSDEMNKKQIGINHTREGISGIQSSKQPILDGNNFVNCNLQL